MEIEKISVSFSTKFLRRTALALFLISLAGISAFHVAPAAASSCIGPSIGDDVGSVSTGKYICDWSWG